LLEPLLAMLCALDAQVKSQPWAENLLS